MDTTFTCPRQAQEAVMRVQLEHVAHLRDDGTCSYCGSISQEAFFAAAEAGNQITPTDKNYKAYVELATDAPGTMEIVHSTNSDKTGVEGWIEATPEVCAQYGWTPWAARCWVSPTPRPATRTAKFYFQHLDQDGRLRLIEMINARSLNMAYPGHFYVWPYFCTTAVDP